MAHPQTLIFDLDGTLIDSAPDLHAAVNAALTDIARPPLDLATVTTFIGNGVDALVARSLIATGGTNPALHTETLGVFRAAYDANSATRTRCYPGVADCLTSLRDRGHQLGLCTNKPQDPAIAICDRLGLAPFFAAIHGARADVPKKPDPTSLLNCLAELGGDRDTTLFVGDSHIDHKTARNAGIGFAFFTGGYLNGALDGPPPRVQFDDWSQNWLGGL